MGLGLTAGLSVAALLLARRFLRSSAHIPISSDAPSVTVTDAA
jgi:MATE family multidrug resistance protein